MNPERVDLERGQKRQKLSKDKEGKFSQAYEFYQRNRDKLKSESRAAKFELDSKHSDQKQSNPVKMETDLP